MAKLRFVTNHARVLVCIAREPGIRLRHVALHTGLTERAVWMIVGDLCEEGYLTKHRLGARNFYEVHPELPLRGGADGEGEGEGPEVGRLLALLGARGEREGEQVA
jgi:hypothetical protein